MRQQSTAGGSIELLPPHPAQTAIANEEGGSSASHASSTEGSPSRRPSLERKDSILHGWHEDSEAQKDRPGREHLHESSKKRHSQLKEAEAARNEDGPDSQMLPGPDDRRLSAKAKKRDVFESGREKYQACKRGSA